MWFYICFRELEEERCEQLRLKKTEVVEGFQRNLQEAGGENFQEVWAWVWGGSLCDMTVGGSCQMCQMP